MLNYQASAGERNDVTVDYDAATRTMWLTDRKNTVLPALDDGGFTLQRCSLRANGVKCVGGAMSFVEVTMGLKDANDVMLVRAATNVYAVGGQGLDHLTANSSGLVTLIGDGDADTLTVSGIGSETLGGGAGNDRLRGGAGRTSLFGGPGADDMNGGPGDSDWVHYDPRDLSYYDPSWAYVTTGVHVTFNDSADDGQPGEGDNIRGDVERVSATDFDDEIIGNDGDQWVFARTGDDSVDGAGGDDLLSGWSGNDTLVGGAGRDTVDGGNPGTGSTAPEPDDDVIRLRDGEPDVYQCGLGVDLVEADSLDSFQGFGNPPSECETVEVG